MIAAALVALAALLALAALVSGLRVRLLAGVDPAWAGAAGGASLALAIVLLDGGHALRWRYGLAAGTARVELPGVGWMLGLTLVVSLAGTLLTGAPLVAGSTPRALPRLLGRRILMLAAGLAAIACGVLARELARLGTAPASGIHAAIVLGLGTGLLVAGMAAMLSETGAGDLRRAEALAARLTLVTAVVAAAAVVAAGAEGWVGSGSYLTPRSAAVLAAALVARAAREATALPNLRRALTLAALTVALAP